VVIQDKKSDADNIKRLPCGSHICVFYNSPDDLSTIFTPFFQAGLENNEYCIWIPPDPGNKSDRAAIDRVTSGFSDYLKTGQLMIFQQDEFYLENGVFKGARAFNILLLKYAQALAKGYRGVRVGGCAPEVENKEWLDFHKYEAEANNSLERRNMVVLCAYAIDKCWSRQLIDILNTHKYVLNTSDSRYVFLGNRNSEPVSEADKEPSGTGASSEGFCVIESGGKYLEVDDAYCRMTGYISEQLLTMSVFGIEVPENAQDAADNISQAIRNGSATYTTRLRRKDGRLIDVEVKTSFNNVGKGQFQTFTRQVAEGAIPLQSVEIRPTPQPEHHGEEPHQIFVENLRKELQESEDRFHKAARASSDIFIITTVKEGRFIDVNDNFFRVFGYKRDEVIGRTSTELNLWIDPKAREKLAIKMKRQGRIQGEEISLRTKSGEIRNLKYSIEFHNIEGQPCIISVMTDITGRKNEEEKEKAIISTAIDGFWITDNKGHFLEVNDSYCQMIGYSREELLKMSITDIEALEKPEETAARIKKLIIHGSDRFRTKHRCKNGKILDIEINTNYYHVGEGQFFVFIHDLSGTKEAEISRNTRLETRWRTNITRLQEKFTKEGFQNFEDREIIELLLSLVMPARKARQLAFICIDRFKTLGNFLKASPAELTQIGVTPACVFCIDMLHKLPIKVLQEKISEQSIYDSPQDIFEYFYYSMRDLKKEVCKIMFLNARNQIMEIVDFFEGTADKITVDPREVVESAIARGTRALVFVHNHPSGDPTPSQADKQLTRDLVFVGNILQIKVLDHIIIGENRYYSFAAEGLIREYETDFLNLRLTGTAESRRRMYRARRSPGL
jgi:DNA repair protein RadC